MPRHHISILLRIIALLLICATALGEDLAKGKIIEKVTCQMATQFSYALYVPSQYSPNKHWPIVYGFDPGARGLNPVERFKDAAEKYGYIVVGSHNSRNGAGVPLLEIMQAMWADTHARLAIDDQRIYTTGMSGGARVAGMMGARIGVTGVIACGAGFPQGLTPSKDIPFAFVSIIGNEDFNYIELKQLEKAFAPTPIAHHLIVFDGPHRWPPPEPCTEAIEWMEVQAIQTGRKAKDEALLTTLYAKRLDNARAFEAANKPYEAWQSYDALAKSFKGLRDVSAVATKAQQLAATKDVKNALKQEKEELQRQENQTRDFYELISKLDNSDTRFQASNDLKRMIADLKKKAEREIKTDAERSEQLIARRMLGQISISSSEEANRELQSKNFAQAAAHLMIAAELRPDNAQLWFRLAAAYAQANEKKRALEALQHAVDKGFRNAAELESSAAFASLRSDNEFKKLLEKIKTGQ